MVKTCPNGQELKFVLNNQIEELDVPADKTILQAVRELGLTGSKEGCASGDCGACTVLVGVPSDQGVRYQTVNACIAPIGQQAGRHIVTVEGLESPDGELHPAQEKMVDCHGSQCGFCTPGFVMSLAALVEADVSAEREEVLQGISGNLCRCTGYRPIVEAGIAALEVGASAAIQGQELVPSVSASKALAVLQPVNESELQESIREFPNADLIAGGTDLMLEVTQRYEAKPQLIDVTRVEELQLISEGEEQLVIGAAVSYSRLEEFFSGRSTPFVSLLHRLGSRQIRNSGTLGGNLANGSPIADTPPILIAWDAQIETVNTKGESRLTAVSDFYRGYRDTTLSGDEYIARIHIPLASIESFHRFYKSSKRLEDDISSVMGAFRFEGSTDRITMARIAFGGMAATPVRLKAIEDSLTSSDLSKDLIAQVVDALSDEMTPLTDVRASAAYRSEMAASMLERALLEFMGEARPVITEVTLDA